MLLTTYVYERAAAALEQGADRLPNGAIVVKENYMPNREMAAVTVMYKRTGYNPDHNDYLYTGNQ